MRHDERIAGFVEAIWEWYGRHKRVLPWRDLMDSDPDVRAYKVLVSEVMLQQTQVPRVIVKYKEFVQRFPSLEALSNASNRDVILAWRGMGYNSRALRLRDAARALTPLPPSPLGGGGVERGEGSMGERDNDCRFPSSMSVLLSIPGIGRYTAAALRNFAFNIPTPCIDTNIRRILHRTFVGPEKTDGTWERDDVFLLELAGEILKVAGNPREWHAALMDFGSLVQTKRNPKWEICPLTARGLMKTTERSYKRSAVSGQWGKVPPSAHRSSRTEPGRVIGGRFTPNRIVRGRIVELLRDAKTPLTLERIGREVCIDWEKEKHRSWLNTIVEKLTRDRLVERRGRKLLLCS
ncbi:MAG: A/G-specific adenine glycosylase [Candidatus Peregrinibacteria bacterium Gr01-1014_25]|nr:MAG: A/G-specific adenine glycosylase [Candidatus Peregrinibacteria bacterium Gr01-1014_25]